jgi:hypothetical protein
MPLHDAPEEQVPPGDAYGWVGLAAGLLAVALALLPGWIAPLYDPPSRSLPTQAADWLGRLRDQAAEAVGGQPAPPPAPDELPNPWRDPRIVLGSLLLGFAALALAAIAFARRESARVTACAVALGAGAIAAEYLFTALVILLFAGTAVALAAGARRG